MSNSNEYMRNYMLRRYHTRIAEAKAYLGGKCVDCQTDENLEFDHIIPEDKTFNIGKVWSYSKVKFWTEIDKCTLRCVTCHKARTSEQQSVDHGGGLTGKKNCRCDLCSPLKREYVRTWRLSHGRRIL